MNRAYERESGDYEFNPEMGEFDEAEYGEAEFDEAEFDEAEVSVRDHRRRGPPPPPPPRPGGYPQRRYASRFAGPPRPFRYPTRPRYPSRSYGARPYGAGRQYRWTARPAYSSRFYMPQQAAGPYNYRYAQQQPYFAGLAPRWGHWRRWMPGGRWPYGQRGYVPSPQPSYDEPQYPEPAYAEPPPPPPPVIVPPPPMVQPAMAEPPSPPPSTAEPTATPPDQPAPGELYIEPEAFEFDPESDEYQGEQEAFAGGFGEYEYGSVSAAAAHGAVSSVCARRGREVEDRGGASSLRRLRGAGPGVDRGLRGRLAPYQAEPRARCHAEGRLVGVIARMRASSKLGLSIFGFSDCVGRENNNTFLRRGRAQRVQQLLLQLASPADRRFLNSENQLRRCGIAGRIHRRQRHDRRPRAKPRVPGHDVGDHHRHGPMTRATQPVPIIRI